ncbi:MAG: hypothetical protein KF687_05045 [Cyclobacteriaceae bacterium]|nr:hypothetical protein [Cyclobacteriaceae bacterium]
MKKSLILSACFIVLITSCNQKKSEQDTNKMLYNQVMDVHDEVMPSIDELIKLKKILQEKIENSPDLVAEKREELEQTIESIEAARRGMMSWMREFRPEEFTGDELTSYLEEEMKRVQTVKDNMLDALEKGRKNAQE